MSFEMTYQIKIIKNHLTIIYYKFLILILKLQNFIYRTIIMLLIKQITIFLKKSFFKKLTKIIFYVFQKAILSITYAK